jgi:hypothetical protein
LVGDDGVGVIERHAGDRSTPVTDRLQHQRRVERFDLGSHLGAQRAVVGPRE